MPARRLLAPLAAVALLTAGCVTESRDGDTTVVAFAPWVGLLAILGGLAAVPVGLLARRWKPFLGWALVVLGPVGLVVLAPGLFLDRVTVSPEKFTLWTGFWFSPTVHEVRYDGLSEVAITAEERTGRRGRKSVSYYLECRGKGGAQKVPVGDLMKEGGLKHILDMADRKDIPIVDRTGGK